MSNPSVQIKRGISQALSGINPTINYGELICEQDTLKLKIGDGTTTYNNLPNLFSGIYLTEISEDTSPQLGGDLDINSNDIIGTGNIFISGDLSANSGYLDVLSFNVDNESLLTKGQISWDDTEGTMDIGLTDNTTIHIGEHRYFRIRNQTNNTLYKGQVVYATGVHSNGLITPDLYIADGSIREVRFMGVVLENVSVNNNGYVIDFGHLEEMDLDGSVSDYAVGDETWLPGDILYVHPTVSGKLTKIEPKHSIIVALILDVGNGNGNGRMFVRPTSYGHLNDNHDVNITGVLDGQFLQYNSSTDYWTPSSSGNFTTLQLNGSGVLVEHPSVTASTGIDNNGRTYIQDILVDNYGHVTGLTSATETVIDTDTTYTAGTGLYLDNTIFNISGVQSNLIQGTIDNNQLENSTINIVAGTGLFNGGTVALGSSVSIDIDETVIQSGDNISLLNNDSNYLTSISGNYFQDTPSGTLIGLSGQIYQTGQHVISNGGFGVRPGDSQYSRYLLRIATTGSGYTNLLMNNNYSGILSQANTTYGFDAMVVGRRTDDYGNAAYKLEGVFYNDGLGAVIIGNPVKTILGETDSGWDSRVSTTGDYLLIQANGGSGQNINWVANVNILEVGSFGTLSSYLYSSEDNIYYW